MPVLHIEALTKDFGDVQVLRGLSLDVGNGQICGLLGGNGAGKTTAINIVTGLLSPDGGTVAFDGGSTSNPRRRALGVAPQEAVLYPRLTCSENVAFFGGLYSGSRERVAAQVEATLALTQLAEYGHVRASNLSGGIRRRLNIAIAIVHEPDVLILDEPTAGLDIEARYSLWDVIRELRDSGTAILLTTHLLDEAAALCDRIAILHEGKIEREGTLDELRGTVDARQIAEIESEDEDSVSRRAVDLGLAVRRRGGQLALFLTKETTLESLVQSFSGTGVRSVSLRPVTLEDVYFDATTDREPA
jgi:ABC-2 type transport system ATP-binding protein